MKTIVITHDLSCSERPCIMDLIEEPVSDSYSSLCDVDYFADFLELFLNHVLTSSIVVVLPWFKSV